MALIHGGQLQQVAQQYNIPLSEWLDVSTGIAPISYPTPSIPLHVWQQLHRKIQSWSPQQDSIINVQNL
jgi:cobalamin biosynthetic protein CobC